jgi:hypothetical protein
MVPSSEMLVEAVPEALKNMLLVLASRDVLRAGWSDPADGSIDLWVPWLACLGSLVLEHVCPVAYKTAQCLQSKPGRCCCRWEATWRSSRKISSALAPALLATGQQQQQQQQAGLT